MFTDDKEIKVFIAMPYFEGNSEIIAEYNKIYKDTIEDIGENAFANCFNLTSINIPNSIKKINTCTFFLCTKLTSITIPDSITSIEYEPWHFRYVGKEAATIMKEKGICLEEFVDSI